ncbi:MAG: flagellar basal body rod protein FlgB [Actinobacteria bacterium]|nr:flagellar basal body rod protein FlgB [Actinomycetota bacterium]
MIDDPIISILEKAVSGASLRHEAILNNISNVNTPGYKRIDVDFKAELSKAAKGIGEYNKNQVMEEIESANPEVFRETGTSVRPDGNNVDIDREMSLLAESALEYNTYISLLSRKFKNLLNVINEGRK